MNVYFLFTLIILLAGCNGNNVRQDFKPSNKSTLVDEISYKVFLDLKKNKDLYPCECGGRMMDQITFLHWGFDYYKEIDIDEARELLIAAENQFLKAFNGDERIHPYLGNYPLTTKKMQIVIFLHKPDGSEIEPEKLHVIAINEGILDYMIGKLGTERLKKIYKETYEEAMARLDAQYSDRN